MTSSQKTIKLTDVISNNTITPIKISLKTVQLVHKENVTLSPIVIETHANQKTQNLVEVSHNSLARKGRYMRRRLLKNKKSQITSN